MKNSFVVIVFLLSVVGGLGLLGVFSSPKPHQSWKREVAQSSKDFPFVVDESTKEKIEFSEKTSDSKPVLDESIVLSVWNNSIKIEIEQFSYQLSQTTLASFEEIYQAALGSEIYRSRGIVYYRPLASTFDRVRSENALLVLKDENTEMTVLATGRFILKFKNQQIQADVLDQYGFGIYYQQARLNLVFTETQTKDSLFELYEELKADERVESVELELLGQPAILR